MILSFVFPRPFPGADRLRPDGEACSALEDSHIRAGRPRRVLAALSGGADSTALVCMLSSLRGRMGIGLFALHVNHGLRPGAGRDEAFCAELCSLLDIPFRAVRISLTGRSEDEARKMRYAALRGEAARVGADAVAAAHHMRDQGETVLLSLMRGSVRGVGGMREAGPLSGSDAVLWRPLLGFRPDFLRDYLRERGIPWTEDETNSDTRYLRNAVREEILPRMENARQGALVHIVTAGRILREESDLLDSAASALLRGRGALSPCPFILARPLFDAPKALRRRALRLFLDALGLSDRTDTALLEALAGMEKGQSVNAGGGYRAVRGEERLCFVPPPGDAAPPAPSLLPFRGDPGDGKRLQSVPEALYAECRMRYPLPGDFIVPFGRNGRRSLNDFLSRKKIDPAFRSRVPVLAAGNEVIWAVGAGASEKARASDPPGRQVLLCWPHLLPGESDPGLFCSTQPFSLSDFGL